MPLSEHVIPVEIENPETEYWNNLAKEVIESSHQSHLSALETAEAWFALQDIINAEEKEKE